MFLLDDLLEFGLDVFDNNSEIGTYEYSLCGVDAREGQKIFDERLHAFCSFLDPSKIILAFVAEIRSLRLVEPAGEGLYLPQGFLQVVTRHVCECEKLLV